MSKTRPDDTYDLVGAGHGAAALSAALTAPRTGGPERAAAGEVGVLRRHHVLLRRDVLGARQQVRQKGGITNGLGKAEKYLDALRGRPHGPRTCG